MTIATSVAAFANSGQSIIAATSLGLYRSVDFGATWRTHAGVPVVVQALAYAATPDGDPIGLAGGAPGVLRSLDDGISWTTTLVGSPVSTLAIGRDRTGDLVALAGTETDGIFRSRDGGASWASANAGLLDLETLVLAVSPAFARDNTGFAGAATGLYRTRNGGKAWRPLELPAAQPAVQCLALAPDFDATGVVLAGTEEDGLVRSADGGRTWKIVPSLGETGVTALAPSPANPNRYLAATAAGIARSDDAGATWRPLAESGPALALAFVAGPDREIVLAGLAEGGIMRSRDGGVTWQHAELASPAEVTW